MPSLIVPLSEPPSSVRSEPRPPQSNQQPVGAAVLARIRGLDGLLESVLASWHNSRQILQVRRWHRLEYAQPLCLTPLDENEQLCDESWLVDGRDLSLGGLSFRHRRALVCRKAAVTFLLDADEIESVVVRLTWCRFTQAGIYESGGPFVRRLAEAPPQLSDWRLLPRA